MPRHRRIDISGAVHHVITRGLDGKDIFRVDADRTEFLHRLADSLVLTGYRCYAWALMTNHLHLSIRTGERPLSDLMRKILTGYAIYFNRRHRRHGYLYQNRYKSIMCQEDVYFFTNWYDISISIRSEPALLRGWRSWIVIPGPDMRC